VELPERIRRARYFAAPIVFLTAGILPVETDRRRILPSFIAFMIANQLLFHGGRPRIRTWRGQQYSLALSGVDQSLHHRAAERRFESRSIRGHAEDAAAHSRVPWHLAPHSSRRPVAGDAVVIGGIRLVFYGADPLGTGVNVFWAAYDLLVLNVLVKAVRYRGYQLEGTTSNAIPNRTRRGRHSRHSR
jgi:cellulose synthase (UDP-forming)